MEKDKIDLLDWLITGTTVTLFYIAVIRIGILLLRWYSKKIRLEITVDLWKVDAKSSWSEGETVYKSLGFLIGIIKKSDGPVFIKSYYLELPISFARRIGQSSFHLTDLRGRRQSVPIELEDMQFLSGVLDYPHLNNYLINKKVRFVVFDQFGRKHRSPAFLIDINKGMKGGIKVGNLKQNGRR